MLGWVVNLFRRKLQPAPARLSALSNLVDENEIDEVERALGRLTSSRASRFAMASTIFKIAVALGAGIIAYAQCITLPQDNWPMWPVVGAVAAVAVSVISLLMVFLDPDPATEIDRGRQAVLLARRSHEAIRLSQGLRNSTYRLTELHEALRLMIALLERRIPDHAVNDDDLPDQLLTATWRSLLIAMNFQLTHYWTLSVYKFEPKPGDACRNQLRVIASRRTIHCDPANARTWDEGMGMVGMCAQRRTDLLVPDIQSDDLGSIYDLQSSKPDDRKRYRSIYATPILTGPSSDLWGVVIASSDAPHHFSRTDDPTAIETVNSFAAVISMAIGARRAPSSPPTPSAAPSLSPTPAPTAGSGRRTRAPRSGQNPPASP